MGDRIIEAAAEAASKQLLMSISAVNKEEYYVSISSTRLSALFGCFPCPDF